MEQEHQVGQVSMQGHRANVGPPCLRVRGAGVTLVETASWTSPSPTPTRVWRQGSYRTRSLPPSAESLEPHCPLLLLVGMAGPLDWGCLLILVEHNPQVLKQILNGEPWFPAPARASIREPGQDLRLDRCPASSASYVRWSTHLSDGED